MREYDFKLIEKKWQEKWASISLYKTDTSSSKKKCYVLDMFPYPSGEGLHVGHPKGYIATDVYSRVKKMEGYEVLHPMGWDAFGLPAEQFAIKNKVHPSAAVTKNVSRYKEQLSLLGFNYDWSREINTTDPAFYKWTQWIFKQMYKKGLAYESNEPINWCPSCQTGLANEDLEGGLCERCGSVVEKKPLRQWVLKITEYADRMLEDLNELNWPEHIKESQRNWIGKKEGAEFDFTLVDAVIPSIKVFTTRPDTLYGVTFLAISFDVAKNWISSGWKADNAVLAKIDELEKKAKDLSIGDKDGIFTGLYAINPATQEKIQVWVANYVLSGVGTGALMGVPAHDERDFDFAKKYSLPIRAVISNSDTSLEESVMKAYSGDGVLISSADFSGVPNREAKSLIVEKFGGKIVTKYALQDWVFARQRYWGEPFPIVFNENNIPYLVADSELPVRLPDVEHYEPSGTGESPLATITDWVNVYGTINKEGEFISLPKDHEDAKLFRRETNTMPQWAGSSWYYLRYLDPNNESVFLNKEIDAAWSPVDFYVGGAEHATRHLIYARFWHKVLFDLGFVSHKEPFKRLQNVGLILAEDGRKMSKRFGNVINPDDVVAEYGADTLRVYEMFMGPFDQSITWSTQNMKGSFSFLQRVWKAYDYVKENPSSDQVKRELHKVIKKVTEDIELFKFNTAISQMMICLNAIEKEKSISKEDYALFLQVLAPFAPHIAEELWYELGNTSSVHLSSWPTYEEKYLVETAATIAIQISGKMRGTFTIDANTSDEMVINAAKMTEVYQKYVGDNEPKKIIVIKNKLINIVL